MVSDMKYLFIFDVEYSKISNWSKKRTQNILEAFSCRNGIYENTMSSLNRNCRRKTIILS